MRRPCLLAIVVVLAACVPASPARADGDPGSDVLVNQSLFLASDAGVSVREQVALGDLLGAAPSAGFQVRVAIIASRFDLGSVTELWRQPRAYARFLGLELSLAYTGRLIVVMPDGLGFNWPGHSSASAYRLLAGIRIAPGGAGLAGAATAAVRRLAAGAGVSLGSAHAAVSRASAGRGGNDGARPAPVPGSATDTVVALVVFALAGVAAAIAIARRTLRRRGMGGRGRRAAERRLDGAMRLGAAMRLGQATRLGARLRDRSLAVAGASLVLALLLTGAVAVLAGSSGSGPSDSTALAQNPVLDSGTSVSGPAPGFTLTDQFGRRVSLHSFRGRVVILAFTDSECTTLCPLTTTAMLDAKAMLGRAGSQVQLLGVDANPAATSIEDVWSYSEVHGMLHSWRFLTGSFGALQQVWRRYKVEAAINHGQITHSPYLFVIDPQGREAKVYLTVQSYAAVGQFGELLAREASSLLPGRPAVHSDLSYARVPTIGPRASVTLPVSGGAPVRLGPGRSPHLYLFFATWDQEMTSMAGHLSELDGYAAAAAHSGLPALTAVDEGSVEPTPTALASFLHTLPRPPTYPVAIDSSGRVADGYEVLGLPWFVLTSAGGRILWYHQVSTQGWPTSRALAARVRDALAHTPARTTTATVVQELAGSPAPLASLHAQASRLLGGYPTLLARIRALRGYPVVLNLWASWCSACRAEFGLLASAAARFGRRVAFLGADAGDSATDARGFLAQHPVAYPSYQASLSQLSALVPINGLPVTVFITRAGKVKYISPGTYYSQGSLDGDIATYALGG